jgi:hypothetical protein
VDVEHMIVVFVGVADRPSANIALC